MSILNLFKTQYSSDALTENAIVPVPPPLDKQGFFVDLIRPDPRRRLRFRNVNLPEQEIYELKKELAVKKKNAKMSELLARNEQKKRRLEKSASKVESEQHKEQIRSLEKQTGRLRAKNVALERKVSELNKQLEISEADKQKAASIRRIFKRQLKIYKESYENRIKTLQPDLIQENGELRMTLRETENERDAHESFDFPQGFTLRRQLPNNYTYALELKFDAFRREFTSVPLMSTEARGRIRQLISSGQCASLEAAVTLFLQEISVAEVQNRTKVGLLEKVRPEIGEEAWKIAAHSLKSLIMKVFKDTPGSP